MNNCRYKAVLFDLDGTLRASLPEGFEIFVEFAHRVGVALDSDQARAVERAAHRYWAGGAQVDADLARFDTRGFWVNYNHLLLDEVQANHTTDHVHQIQDLFDTVYDPQDAVYVDSYHVLGTLRGRGITVGLVSNREEPLDPYVEKINLRSYFHFTLSGGQAGSYKPSPGIFEAALKLAGDVPPAEALYVGDNYYADVVGAQNAGLSAILVDPRNAFAGFHNRRVRHLRDILPQIL